MTLMQTYDPLFVDLPAAALTKIGSFAGQVQRAQTADAVGRLVKEAMSELASSEAETDAFFGLLRYTATHGSPSEKEAIAALLPYVTAAARELDGEAALTVKTAAAARRAGGGPMSPENAAYSQQHFNAGAEAGAAKTKWSTGDKVNLGLGLAGLAATAVPFAAAALRRRKRDKAIHQAHLHVLMSHPELRGDAMTGQYYQTLADFAPDVAANPLIAGEILKQVHRTGGEGVSPAWIKELLDIQRMRDERHRAPEVKADIGKAFENIRWPNPSKKT